MPRRGRRVKHARGIYRDRTGWAVCWQVGGTPQERRFPPDKDLGWLKDWRTDEIKKAKKRRDDGRPVSGTFAADAALYLNAVTALPTYEQRKDEIAYWVALFGPRRRDSIEPHEIRAARDRMLTVGPKRVQKRQAPGLPARWTTIAAPLAPSTVNKRLRALENLWTVLDGKKAPNPVREVPEPDEGSAPPRALSYAVIERILGAMPARHPMTVRLRVMAYAGLAQSELARVTVEGINLEARAVWVPGRKKGRGARGGWVPLSPKARAAFRDLVTLDAVGPFSTSTLWHHFQRYARPLGYRVRPYDLRHSLFTGLYESSGDERAVAAVSRHASVITLRRYTEAAVQPRAAAAMASFKDGAGTVPGSVPGFGARKGQNRSGTVLPRLRKDQ